MLMFLPLAWGKRTARYRLSCSTQRAESISDTRLRTRSETHLASPHVPYSTYNLHYRAVNERRKKKQAIRPPPRERWTVHYCTTRLQTTVSNDSNPTLHSHVSNLLCSTIQPPASLYTKPLYRQHPSPRRPRALASFSATLYRLQEPGDNLQMELACLRCYAPPLSTIFAHCGAQSSSYGSSDGAT
jgi:hypothetical protein